MNPLTLRLTETTSSIYLFKLVERILDIYYEMSIGVEWDPDKTYIKNSVVLRGGKSYRANYDNKSIDPIGSSVLNKATWTNITSVYQIEDKYLEDNYNTFYNLIKFIPNNYSKQELRWIANYIYNMKGSYQSILEFGRLFNSNITIKANNFPVEEPSEISQSDTLDSLVLTISIDKIIADDFNVFKYYFSKMVDELLFSFKNEFNFKELVVQIVVFNNHNLLTSTELVNVNNLNARSLN